MRMSPTSYVRAVMCGVLRMASRATMARHAFFFYTDQVSSLAYFSIQPTPSPTSIASYVREK